MKYCHHFCPIFLFFCSTNHITLLPLLPCCCGCGLVTYLLTCGECNIFWLVTSLQTSVICIDVYLLPPLTQYKGQLLIQPVWFLGFDIKLYPEMTYRTLTFALLCRIYRIYSHKDRRIYIYFQLLQLNIQCTTIIYSNTTFGDEQKSRLLISSLFTGSLTTGLGSFNQIQLPGY